MAVDTAPATAADQQQTADNNNDQTLLLPSLKIPITSNNNKMAIDGDNANDENSDNTLFIEIFPEELVDTSVATLLQVLRDEAAASPDVWATAGHLLVTQNKAREALQVLQEACEQVMAPSTATSSSGSGNAAGKPQKVRALAATGIATLLAASGTGTSASNNNSSSNNKNDDWTAADQKFTQAGKVDTFFPMTWIGRGLLNLKRSSLDQARFFFQTTKKQCGAVLPAVLGMAAVLLAEQDYKGALQEYSLAIRKFPTASGATARVGLATAAYQLGQVDRAKAAFARARALDPEYVPALVGSAILDLRAITTHDADFRPRMEHAIKLLSVANLLDASNAMVQNHLANHYFWKWTPVTGTVHVTQGSPTVTSPQNLPLDPGERIRIGTTFETTVVADEMAEDDDDDGTTTKFTMAAPWKEASATGLKLWKKDYDRVLALAKGAYSATAVDAVKAESLFFLARVYHVRGELDHAHKFFKKATDLAADLSPARFGLAQTFLAQGDYTAAATHLQKVLQTSTAATDALALLGLLQARSSKTLDEGLGHLRKAVELDPLNPELVLWEALALQQYESHYPKALERYQHAIALLLRRKQKVSPQYYANCGVLCHETKKYDESLEMYQKALIALDDADGTAQACTHKGMEGGKLRQADNHMFFDYVQSKHALQKVATTAAAAAPSTDKDGETTLASSHNHNNNKTWEVVGATEVANVDVEVGDSIRLGKDVQTTVTAVRAAEGKVLMEVADEYDPVDENVEPDAPTPATVSLRVLRENGFLGIKDATTIIFNIARLHEATGRTLAAIELHKAIVKRNPAYVNSYLRLACLAVDCGSLKESSQWLRIAAQTAPGNPEVLTLVGNLHLSLADWQPAQKVFDSLLVKKVPNVEAYASLSLGNIYFATLHASPSRYLKHLQYASDYYKRILAKDPANAYAANGLGTVLAEKAEIFKAKEVFHRVREVSGDNIADTFINLGHIYLAQKKHSEALQMYVNYMKRAEDGTTPITSKSRVDDVVDVLLYIAFAYFDWARHTELFNDAKAAPADGLYKEAMQFLEKAIGKHSKKEIILRFNLCMTKLYSANCVLQKLTRNIPRTVQEVQEALDNLQESLQVVEKISADKAAGQKINISSTALQNFLQHCRANISSAESHLEDEKKRSAEAEQEREIRRMAAEAAAKENQLKKALAEAEQAKKQEEKDSKAAEKMKKVQELRTGWEVEKESQKAAKKKSAKADMDGFIEEDPVEGDGPDAVQAGHGLFEDSDDDDNNESAPAAAAPQPPKDEGERRGGRKKMSAAELFGSSDEEDSDDDSKKAAKPKPAAKTADSPKPSGDPLADSDDDDEEPASKGASAPAPAPAAGASKEDLFGESSDDESDEDLVKDDTAKRSNPDASEDQPKKKRKLVEEDMEDEE